MIAELDGRALPADPDRHWDTDLRVKSMDGPTGKYSITMPRDIAEAARARSGPSVLTVHDQRLIAWV